MVLEWPACGTLDTPSVSVPAFSAGTEFIRSDRRVDWLGDGRFVRPFGNMGGTSSGDGNMGGTSSGSVLPPHTLVHARSELIELAGDSSFELAALHARDPDPLTPSDQPESDAATRSA